MTDADPQSFRAFLGELADRGELIEIDECLKPDYEVAACLSLLDDGPAVVLRRVGDSPFPIVGNVLNSRRRIAAALGVTPEALADRLTDAIAHPLAPVVEDTAPWQDTAVATDFDALPVPSFFAEETGPYLTAGVILARDVISGVANMSYARFKLLGRDTAMLGVSPNHHLGKMVARAATVGKRLPISVAIGNHPAVMLAACLYLGFGENEAACAGSLLGEPLRMASSPRHGIPVPVGSEFVFDAEVHADDRVTEGLVSEYHGMYHDYGSGYLTTFQSTAHRTDALFQVIVPGLHQEHIMLGGVSIAAGLQAQLRGVLPNVTAVAVPDTAAGRTAAVVALHQPKPGQARQAILAAMSAVPLIKHVVVVDADIDVWNSKSVEWARMTRCRPERDFVILPDERTDRSEPLARDFVIGKLGVDATCKADDRAEGFGLARIPHDALARAHEVLCAQGIPPAPSALLDGIRGMWT